MARLTRADLAEKSLDGQYYIWDSDTSGLILAGCYVPRTAASVCAC
jgi:hypothetical protein